METALLLMVRRRRIFIQIFLQNLKLLLPLICKYFKVHKELPKWK